MKRGGMERSTEHRAVNRAVSEGVGGVVNELLVQMQSFDEPTRGQKFGNALRRFANRFLPYHLHLHLAAPSFANILLIGATNRASDLDPALLRPGRFDRALHFGMPARAQRRDLIDFFLGRKAHDETLDDQARDDLAASTMGYSPASLERLFDEGLLFALRGGRDRLGVADLRRARMDIEVGLAEPTEYTPEERTTIAVHESGHATMAYLVGKGRKLELLSIVKRKDALGMLAHSEAEERYTKRRSESLALVQIALGGMVAEELFFGESGTGPAGDLVSATQVAAELVGSMGVGGSLVSFRAIDGAPLAGNLVAKVLADPKARDLLEDLLQEQKTVTRRLLSENRHLVAALRDALLERDELVGREILEVIEEARRTRDLIVDLREPVG
jgi:ATP-dependent Zn protease